MEPNYQNDNYNNMQSNGQSGYPQNPQNSNPYGYQTNYNGYNNGTRSGGFGVGNIGDAFSEAAEALRQKVVAQAFIFMMAALVITAIGAKVASDVLLSWMEKSPAVLILLLVAEIAIVIGSNVALKKNNVVLTASLYTVYSFINGATLGIICMAYVETSVTRVFVITAAMFVVTAFYGLVSKKDLTSIGGFCFMGLIGLIVAGVVNLFLKSTALDFLFSIVGVVVFVGLTAYDTKKIKERAAYADSSNVTAIALSGAFQLYLDFVNLFLYLLKLFGKRR